MMLEVSFLHDCLGVSERHVTESTRIWRVVKISFQGTNVGSIPI